MSYTPQYSATTPPPQPPKKKDDRKIIYGILIAALLGTWGYIIWDKSSSNEQISQLQTQYIDVDSSRNAIQMEYNDALARLDTATGYNTELQGALADRKVEIDKLKNEIRNIASKKNASAAELARAKTLIRELNGKIDDMYVEIQRLKSENQQLTADVQVLSTDKQKLTTEKGKLQENLTNTETAKKNVENLASTLHASNMNVTPVNIKNSGKEKETTTAKRVDLLRISFDLDENRVAPSGTKELYVSVTSPDGRPVTMAEGSGTFETNNDGIKTFTNKIMVPYEQGKKARVSFDWKQEGPFLLGEYTIEVYHNGFKIGEGKQSLKRGGLFG